jgi:DNA-binding NarL/FixJ family response regulator
VDPSTRDPDTHPIRVLLVDDQELVRKGIRMILEGEPDIEIVAEAGDAREAIHAALTLTPDIILMDIQMTGATGIEAASRIKEILPTTLVLMLTSSEEEDDVYEAIKAGASGYLLKTAGVEEMTTTVRRVAAGDRIISAPLAGRVTREFATVEKGVDADAEELLPKLTERERRVLELVAAGALDRKMKTDPSLSHPEVRTAVRNILDKLHLRSRLEVAARSVEDATPEEK